MMDENEYKPDFSPFKFRKITELIRLREVGFGPNLLQTNGYCRATTGFLSNLHFSRSLLCNKRATVEVRLKEEGFILIFFRYWKIIARNLNLTKFYVESKCPKFNLLSYEPVILPYMSSTPTQDTPFAIRFASLSSDCMGHHDG